MLARMMVDDEREQGRMNGHRRLAPGRQGSGRPDDLAKALRKAYHKTVEEEVPDALMDLIRKLK